MSAQGPSFTASKIFQHYDCLLQNLLFRWSHLMIWVINFLIQLPSQYWGYMLWWSQKFSELVRVCYKIFYILDHICWFSNKFPNSASQSILRIYALWSQKFSELDPGLLQNLLYPRSHLLIWVINFLIQLPSQYWGYMLWWSQKFSELDRVCYKIFYILDHIWWCDKIIIALGSQLSRSDIVGQLSEVT